MHVNPTIAALLERLNNPSLPGIDLSLVRMRQLLIALDNPHLRLPPVIHVAGTNGKGSTIAFLRAIYAAAGYRVHAYTSPHLVQFNERIVLAGSEISDDYLLQLLMQVNEAARTIPVTFFEATTAASFLAFSESAADIVLLETGLGGRLDATNMVPSPLATVMTPIDYDHMEFLGNTLTAIATEKAGIMKRDVPCFSGAQKPEAREILKRTARERHCDIHVHGRAWGYQSAADHILVECGTRRWKLPLPALPGVHQHHNAALASVVAQSLPAFTVHEQALAKGVANAQWPARLQQLTNGPLVDAWGTRGSVFLDGGHNAHAAAMLREWVRAQPHPVTLVLGMMQRKDADAFLAPLAEYIHTMIAAPIPDNGCYAPADLALSARRAGIAQVTSVEQWDILAPLLAAAPLSHGSLLIAGSLFLAGEVLKNHS